MSNSYGKYMFVKSAIQTGSVSITNPTGGVITSNKTSGNVGTVITLTCTPSTNYSLRYFTLNGSAISGNSFSLVEGTNTVSAVMNYTAPVTIPPVNYYTLSFVYIDQNNNVISTRSSQSYEEGTTITPSDFEKEITNYNLTTINPSSPFYITSDTTITYTYTAIPVIVKHTLTLVYANCGTNSKTKTLSVNDGTTINPSTYLLAFDGYKINSYTPNTSFTITSDTTITYTYEKVLLPLTAPVITVNSVTQNGTVYNYSVNFQITNNNNVACNAYVARQSSISTIPQENFGTIDANSSKNFTITTSLSNGYIVSKLSATDYTDSANGYDDYTYTGMGI